MPIQSYIEVGGQRWPVKVTKTIAVDTPSYDFQQEVRRVQDWHATFSIDASEFFSGLERVRQAMSRLLMLANPSPQTRAFLRVKKHRQARTMYFVHTKYRIRPGSVARSTGRLTIADIYAALDAIED